MVCRDNIEMTSAIEDYIVVVAPFCCEKNRAVSDLYSFVYSGSAGRIDNGYNIIIGMGIIYYAFFRRRRDMAVRKIRLHNKCRSFKCFAAEKGVELVVRQDQT